MKDLGQISGADLFTVTFALFAVIDILGSMPILVSLKNKMGGRLNALQATLISGLLMLLFFFIGDEILRLMSVDVSSFAIAGSIVIFILGIEMVLGVELFKSDTNARTGIVVPIAFPLIAGSGTLTTIMSLKAEYNQFTILLGILINLVIVFIVLRSLDLIERLLGPAGIAVVRKFFGVILLAIAIKIFRSNAGL
jgi:multiple antibiotic resistance protein